MSVPAPPTRAPWLNDGDCRLYHGDVLDVLAGLPDESVDCVVTSPPYWGLRDYGTGTWEGGDHSCDHDQRRREFDPDSKSATDAGAARDSLAGRDVCRKCGARRVDQQIGLEPTPDAYVHNIVNVFREVRRVLAAHGTVWCNLGDSYNSSSQNNHGKGGDMEHRHLAPEDGWAGHRPLAPGLKQKDLVGVPWRVAFALQADGWWLRSDVIWAKPNPMPESVTDRPTKSHEYVFLLTKQPRYYFDQEAVREPHNPDGRHVTAHPGPGDYSIQERSNGDRWPNSGRNVRSVWTIATQPYPEAHFATYPEELVRRCVLAGSPTYVCTACNTPVLHGKQEPISEPEAVQAELRRVRDVLRRQESEVLLADVLAEAGRTSQTTVAEAMRGMRPGVPAEGGPNAVLHASVLREVGDEDGCEPALVAGRQASGELEGRQDPLGRICEGVRAGSGLRAGAPARDGAEARAPADEDGVRSPSQRDQDGQPPGEPGTHDAQSASGDGRVSSLWGAVRDSLSSCCHAPLRPGTVLDPFVGSGTTCKVARDHGRHSIGIDLNEAYLELAARRLQQLSLLTAEGA